jgi:hypothetical protein
MSQAFDIEIPRYLKPKHKMLLCWGLPFSFGWVPGMVILSKGEERTRKSKFESFKK